MPEDQAKISAPSFIIEECTLQFVENKMVQMISSPLGVSRDAVLGLAAQAALYHLQTGGNRTRARICLSASACLGVSYDDALCLSACAELLHNASLIHDDLQDQEKIRHGLASVWIKYTPGIAICAGDLMISSAFGILASISQIQILPSLLSATHATVATAIRGQCDDLNATNPFQMTLQSYMDVVKAKSGALLSLPLELALIASENFLSLSDARKAAEDFSVGYQIADDLLDIENDSASETRHASLNIYFVLQKDISEGMAKDTASLIGRKHFASSHHLAGKLPRNCGNYLQKLASEMPIFL